MLPETTGKTRDYDCDFISSRKEQFNRAKLIKSDEARKKNEIYFCLGSTEFTLLNKLATL